MLARPRLSHGRRVSGAALCATVTLAACAGASATQRPRIVVANVVEQEQRVQPQRQVDKARMLGVRLVLSLQNGDSEPARRHIEAGADVDAFVPGDGTPLVVAARKRDIAIARMLLDAGADVNLAAPGDGAPLVVAAARGDLAMVELFVEHGADPNIHVPGDETPLINAARYNWTSVARFLLEKGADANLAVDLVNWRGNWRRQSPLGEALQNGNFDMARLLRESGARS